MSKRRVLPIALTVAGSDSGGGAGIQADLKTFAALGVHGTSAVTCVTAQNPCGVRGIQPCSPAIVRQQIEAVFAELRPAAVKTGMLFSAGIVRAVADSYRATGPVSARPPLVVDPVMVATSGARLLRPEAIRALTDELFPLAIVVTPNVDEAELLAGRRLRTVEDLRWAAREIHRRWGCAVLLKGGHLRHLREAADLLRDGRGEWLLTAPFVRGVSTHGTGCTYSAAITGFLARGVRLARAVQNAKEYVSAAIAGSVRAGRHDVLRCCWRR